MRSLFRAIELNALNNEFKVFGFFDPECDECEYGNLFHTPECLPDSHNQCRGWILTQTINLAMKGLEDQITWNDEAARTYTLDEAIEYIMDNIQWEQVATVLHQNGLSEHWLNERLWPKPEIELRATMTDAELFKFESVYRIDLFELWIKAFYFDKEALEHIYICEEDDLRDEWDCRKTEEWLMHNHD